MKSKTLIFLFTISFLPLFSQHTFPVCDVELATEPIAETPALDAYQYVVDRVAEKAYYENPEKGTINPKLEAYAKEAENLIITRGQNPVAMAIKMAYAEHRPLTLSPDMMWLLILQGFAEHVDLNAEELRDYFVEHEGKRVLFVKRDDYRRGDANFPWPEVFEAFTDQIGVYTDTSLVKMATDGFSTTGSTEQAAFQVAIMDAMSSYFVYAMQISCGIPEITLEGTPEDWALLEERTAQLAQYELGWWTDALAPILNQFTEASKGNVDTEFWQDIYQLNDGGMMCGSAPFITGWIVNFFPYYYDSPNPWITNPVAVDSFTQQVDYAASLWEDPKTQKMLDQNPKSEKKMREQRHLYANLNPQPGRYSLPAIEMDDLPSGMSSADLLVDYFGEQLAYELYAGFIGISQDPETLALSPQISWLVIDTGEKPSEEDADLYEKWKEQQQTMARGN